MKVIINHIAINDLRSIHCYYRKNVNKEIADNIINDIQQIIESLKDLPDRGGYVNELLEQGNRRYREIHYNTYRIIYRVTDTVNIMLVADSRRDFRSILEERGFLS
ncbi:MAG: type II toxin-antitoxin system RelE/ParE family toxin [Deferribacteraceae bacterium]|jgi:toxin ParE1/3/4|nr:type II toxin-antitoxin system RelE/ParE family toxin [Deferribacteraceae bacterium]